MKKVKRPHPPRCLCNSLLHWFFGIVSPSKHFRYATMWTREQPEQVKKYFAALRDYEEYVFMQRLNARSVTKEEWKQYYRQQRHIARQMKANESFNESMQKLSDAAKAMAESIMGAAAAVAAEIIDKMGAEIETTNENFNKLKGGE